MRLLVQEKLTGTVLDAAFEVHRVLGPGLLESAYESCFCRELDERGIQYERQVEVPVVYKGHPVECGFRIDLIIENRVVIELKATEEILPIHEAQLLTYLRLTGLHVGILINFNVVLLNPSQELKKGSPFPRVKG